MATSFCGSFVGKVKQLLLFNRYRACFVKDACPRIFHFKSFVFPRYNVPSITFSRKKFTRNQWPWLYGSILTSLGISKEEKQDLLINTIKQGMVSLQNEDFNTAEQLFHAALKLAEEQSDDKAMTYIYDLLASAAYQKGDFKEAENWYCQVKQKLLTKGTSKDSNGIVQLSLKIAFMMDMQKNFDQAESVYLFCVKTQREKADKIDITNVKERPKVEKETLILCAISLGWYGKHLLACGKLQEAQDNFLRAYDMSEKVNGPLHHQSLFLMNDIGNVASLKGNYNEAIGYFEKAVENGKIAMTMDLPTFYCNLGLTYMKKGDNSRALESCKQALNLARSTKQKEPQQDALGCLEKLRKLGIN